jgi:hypothetical protein
VTDTKLPRSAGYEPIILPAIKKFKYTNTIHVQHDKNIYISSLALTADNVYFSATQNAETYLHTASMVIIYRIAYYLGNLGTLRSYQVVRKLS